jgi:glutathione synthase/RimK-type ligase-like ATP-grasp enzyme
VHRPVAILYEHPLWFEPLFAELERRAIPFERLHAESHAFDPSARESPYSLVVNRMSPSAWTRGNARAIFHALDYLAYLDGIGAGVLNGFGPYGYEISKARQCALFARLGIRSPRTRVVNDSAAAATAAAGLRFPVLVKPNVGGSGAGIVSFDSVEELEAAELDFGLDGTALVQERIPAVNESIVRVELLGGELLYAIRILLVPGSFNLCPADYCELPGVTEGVSGRGQPIEAYDPPAEVVADAKRIAAAAGMDVCGIEYVVDERDGLPYFYDVNALSNFVADAPNVIGFDPYVNLVDLIVELAGQGSVQVGGTLGDRTPREVLDGALAARLAEARSQLGIAE